MKSESARLLAEECAMRGSPDLAAHRRGLRNLARAIFLDRNAAGMPPRDREKIKAEARPLLRESIGWLRKSRDTLHAGDVWLFELLRDRARMYHNAAKNEFYRPFANFEGERRAKSAKRWKDGVGVRRKLTDEDRNKLKDLIRGCLGRSEPTRHYSKGWAHTYDVSGETVRRIIKEVKAEK